MQVVIEIETVLAHKRIESLFSGMPERRMSNVVHQRQRFDQVNIHVQGRCQRTRNLRNLKGVRQAVAKMIGVPPRENLRLGLQTPESAGVDDAVAVTLEIVAVGMLGLGITPTARLFNTNRVISEHEESLVSKFQGFKDESL
jgi:hypothetical protein